jgi:hypothetical protein
MHQFPKRYADLLIAGGKIALVRQESVRGDNLADNDARRLVGLDSRKSACHIARRISAAACRGYGAFLRASPNGQRGLAGIGKDAEELQTLGEAVQISKGT